MEAEHGDHGGGGEERRPGVEAGQDRQVELQRAQATSRTSANRACSANQTARFRITPTTAAVMADSAAPSAWLPRRVST